MDGIVYCPCGSDITQKSAKPHLKTMKHQEYLISLNKTLINKIKHL